MLPNRMLSDGITFFSGSVPIKCSTTSQPKSSSSGVSRIGVTLLTAHRIGIVTMNPHKERQITENV